MLLPPATPGASFLLTSTETLNLIMSKIYTAAVIGLGRIGSTFDDEIEQGGAIYLPYCHAPTYVAAPNIKLIAGADPHQEQREIFGQRWGLASDHLYEDYRDLLDREKPDLVSIATTARVRAEITIATAQSGAKGIWADKPIALCLEDVDTMVDECEANGVPMVINCGRRYSPSFVETRRMIDEGILGEILQVTAYTECGLSHNGSHAIDIVRYLAGGNVQWVFGEMQSDEAANGENDLSGNGYLAFDNGVRAYIRATSCGVSNWEIDVIGTKGRVRSIANALDTEWTYLTPGGPKGRGIPARSPIATPARPEGGGLALVRDLIKAIESQSQPRCSLYDARDALEIAVALRESHRKGCVRFDLPVEDRSLRILSAEIHQDDKPARIRRLEAAN